MNNLLSICIPTYNGGEHLKDNLDILISNVGKYEIPIIVSDNCSTDDTQMVVEKAQSRYPYLIYSRNEENLGGDKNFEKALKLSQTSYAWLIGDDDTIRNDIAPILEKLKDEKPDFVFLGDPKTVGDTVKEGICEDKHLIFYELANRGLSWMSSNIFSKDMIEKGQFERYYGTRFVHLGVILDYLGLYGMKLLYMHNKYVEMLRPGFVAYRTEIMEIYARGWSNLILRVPGFTYGEKMKHFRKRTEISGMLNNKVLLSAHSQGAFSYEDLKEDYEYIKLYNRSPFFVLAMISVFPKDLGLALRKLYRKQRSR